MQCSKLCFAINYIVLTSLLSITLRKGCFVSLRMNVSVPILPVIFWLHRTSTLNDVSIRLYGLQVQKTQAKLA